MKKKINEIFVSLQGEGFHTGTPAVFIRFSGCNLACPFCDTVHQTYTEMEESEIAEKASKYAVPWVILTGGEPSLQASERLVDFLHQQGKKVAIETNGTLMVPSNLDWITLSPKTEKTPILNKANEVKIVFDGNEERLEHYYQSIQAEHYFLQPCSCKNTQETVRYILEHPHWRLSLQTHKYIGIE